MNYKRFGFIFFILVCFFFHFSSVQADESQESILRVGQLDEVQGDVFIKRGGGLREFPAYNGMSLLEGDLVKTYSDSSVKIIFMESQTVLGENTQIYLSRLIGDDDSKETILTQLSGQTWNKVKSLINADDKHEVETATSVMGVRGTLFSVLVDRERGFETLLVLDGVVEAQSREEYRLNQNGQNVIVSETVDINDDSVERTDPKVINYDDFVEITDVPVIIAIYNDVLERAEQLYEDNENSSFENEAIEKDRILSSIESEMMLEALYEISLAIDRIDTAKQQEIYEQIEQKTGNNIEQLKQNILEKRLKQIEQFDRLKQRAENNGVSNEALTEFIAEQKGTRVLERAEQMEQVKETVTEQLNELQNSNDDDSKTSETNNRTPINDNNEPSSPIEENQERVEIPQEPKPNPGPKPDPKPNPKPQPDPEPNSPPRVVPNIEDTQLQFNKMTVQKDIRSLLESQDEDNEYQFTGTPKYSNPQIAEVKYNTTKTAFTILGKTKGSTDVTVQITDKNGLTSPVTFTVNVESVLPDLVEIPTQYNDELTIVYDHGALDSQDDVIKITASNQLKGYINNWKINGFSELTPYTADMLTKLPSSLEEVQDESDFYPMLLSCNSQSFLNSVPSELCLKISDLSILEDFLEANTQNNALTLEPIMDDFKISAETPYGQGYFVRTYDASNAPMISVLYEHAFYPKTWEVTYEENGTLRTESYKDFILTGYTQNPVNTIFDDLICSGSPNIFGAVPLSLCVPNNLTDDIRIKEIKVIEDNSISLNFDMTTELPIEAVISQVQIYQNGQYMLHYKVLIGLKDLYVNLLNSITVNPNTILDEFCESSPFQFCVSGSSDMFIEIDFEFPVVLALESSGQNVPNEDVGTVEQQFKVDENGDIYDYWLIPHASEGYTFSHWQINNGNTIFDIHESMLEITSSYILDNISVTAVFVTENPQQQ